MKALQNENVSSAVYYPVPLHRQEVFICREHPYGEPDEQ